MSDQEKRAGSADPLPAENSPLNELANSIPTNSGTGSDNLPPVPADAMGGQYQYGGTMPNVAPADAVPPAVGEVQL